MQRKDSLATAILFFTRSAEEEARAKHFIDGDSAASRRIADCLIQHTLEIIRKTGLPYFIINSGNQRGETFGERYANAFADIFALGYQKVISIGNDCASLSPADITGAAKLLNTCDFVGGPDQKGGLYLIAMHRNNFRKRSFAMLPWGTGNLARVISQYCKARGLTLILNAVKRDIHSSGDLAMVLHSQTQLFRLKQLAGNLLNRYCKSVLKNASHFISALLPVYTSLKSPPAH